MLLKDLDFEVAFKYIDEATVADWKGKDLKQAKHIPNIDILLLAVRKVIMVFSRVNNSFTQWQKSQAKRLKNYFLTARRLDKSKQKQIFFPALVKMRFLTLFQLYQVFQQVLDNDLAKNR